MQTLTQYLEQEGISQAEFARQLGVSQPTVNRWALGTADPRRDAIAKIEKLTGGAISHAYWLSPDRPRPANEAAA